MLSLLSLASAVTRWQQEVDMRVEALMELGCLSLGCLLQSKFEVRQVCMVER